MYKFCRVTTRESLRDGLLKNAREIAVRERARLHSGQSAQESASKFFFCEERSQAKRRKLFAKRCYIDKTADIL